MNVQVKSSNGITLVPAESILLSARKIFINGEISEKTACDFLEQMLWLNKEDDEKLISLYINSPGGNVNAGLLIYDVIQDSPAPVRTFCMGTAYGIGAVLLACGNHGRYILPHSETMLRESLLGVCVIGSSSSINYVSSRRAEERKTLNSILSKHTGRPISEIEQAVQSGHYFSAQEAVEFNLCDNIVQFKNSMED